MTVGLQTRSHLARCSNGQTSKLVVTLGHLSRRDVSDAPIVVRVAPCTVVAPWHMEHAKRRLTPLHGDGVPGLAMARPGYVFIST